MSAIGVSLGDGLGLGLQTIASNFISGLVILAERPIRIGDRITLGNISGQVLAVNAGEPAG